jgi:2Fe-2S ferredoxin
MLFNISEMITFEVQDRAGERRLIEVPEGIALSLMEVLKACEYSIAATCGGMALCATCYVEVISGKEKLDEPADAELDMLDTLPNANSNSRLACQIRISSRLQDVVLGVG